MLAMSKEEREAFLAGVHVGIISVADHPRAPLSVPIWYAYQPGGEVSIVTGRSSRKGRRLIETQRFSLCVQEEQPPYKYVSVEGPVIAIEVSSFERDVKPMAYRYLGQQMGDMYLASITEEDRSESVVVRMRPERWLTVDYSKQFASS